MAAGRNPYSVVKTERELLKRNWIRYILLLFAALVYVYFFGGFMPFATLFLVVSAPIISGITLSVSYFYFKFSESLDNRIFMKGDTAEYKMILKNDSPFAIPYVTIVMMLEGQFILSNIRDMRMFIGPAKRLAFAQQMPLRYRGRYTLGIHHILMSDWFGLFTFKIGAQENKSILVKPRIRSLSNGDVPAAMIAQGDETAGLFDQGNEELVNIREYIPGDARKKIHWKLFAKLGEPMTREMRNELDNDILILLNLEKTALVGEESLRLEDCLIESVVSHAHHLIMRGWPIRLCFRKDGLLTIRAQTPGDFQKIHEVLAEVKFDRDEAFSEDMETYLSHGTERALVMICTVTLTGEIIEKALGFKNRGFDIEINHIRTVSSHSKDDEEELVSSLRRKGILVRKLEPDPIPVPVTVEVVDDGSSRLNGGGVS